MAPVGRSIGAPSDLAVAVATAAVGVSVPVLLRLDLARLERLLRLRRARPAPPPERIEHLVRLIDGTRSRARPMLRPGCLTRGLTRWAVLGWAGVPVDLVFGFGRPGTGPAAGHCWLERDGQPFLEPTDPRPVFTETFRMCTPGQTP